MTDNAAEWALGRGDELFFGADLGIPGLRMPRYGYHRLGQRRDPPNTAKPDFFKPRFHEQNPQCFHRPKLYMPVIPQHSEMSIHFP